MPLGGRKTEQAVRPRRTKADEPVKAVRRDSQAKQRQHHHQQRPDHPSHDSQQHQ